MTRSKRYITVSSYDRTYGTSGTFRVNFSDTIRNLKELKLEHACIPYSWYDINGYSILTFEEQAGGGVVNVALTQGNYDQASLAVEVAAKLTASSPNGYTYAATYNAVNGKYTISTSANFKILWTTMYTTSKYNNLWYQLGFNNVTPDAQPDPDGAYALTTTSSGVGAISWNSVVWCTLRPGFPNRLINTSNATITFVLPVAGNWGDKLMFDSGGNYEQSISFDMSGTHIRDLVIELADEDGRPLDFNGVSSTFVFSYTTYDQ